MTSRRFLWLGLGVALLLVANARWILPVATWFFAIGWLVFFDRSRRLTGLAIGFVVYVLVYFVIWWGIIPAPGVLYYLIAATYAVAYFLPFLAHRLLATDVTGFRATLVFPLAWVSVELLFSRFVTPYGSWASLAYTQSDSLTLIQLASLIGTAGITFLIAWFASVVAWMLRPGLETARRVRAASAFGIAILAVIVFGQLRLGSSDTGGSIRTASLVPSRALLDDLEQSLRPVRGGEELSESDMRAIQATATRLNNDLLRRTRREAQAGAKLIAWSETAGRVLASEEERLVAHASRLAAEEDVVLLLALGVWHPDGAPPFENKVVAIDATGAVAWEFHKAHPIVGAESSFIDAGDNRIKSVDQEFGRVGAVICHDLDFPPLLRQASAERIGLMVGPSDDWVDVAPLHGRMAVFRAVENGFTLLRPTNGGRSMAVDTRGRVIAQVDSPDDVMVAHVSAQRSQTLYAAVGDLFSWLCLIGLGLLAVNAKPDGVTIRRV
jgi:apolipoprotein N-acyltransferase